MNKNYGKKSSNNLLVLFLIVLLIIPVSLGILFTSVNGKADTGKNVTAKSSEKIVSNVSYKKSSNTKLEVHFIDVGQGDSMLVKYGDTSCMIDFGNNYKGTAVQNYLNKQNVKTIKYAIGTHPDADHIGGMDVILYKFNVKNVLMPDVTNDTATYRDVVDVCKNKSYKIVHPALGTVYKLGKAKFTVICPVSSHYSDTNSYSIGVRLVYGKTSFVMCGDAPIESEDEMLESGENLKADVLKLNHHGSYTANSAKFINAVNPKYAVVSCGLGNSYGHPYKSVMNRIKKKGIKLFRTDEQGSIVATSNGKKITWNQKPCSDYSSGEELKK